MIESNAAGADESFTLRIGDVAYSYGRTQALKGVSFELSGGVVGLLGPNGAGKSTLLSLIATILRPQTGVIQVLGSDVSDRGGRDAARSAIGLLPQRFALVPSLRTAETVAYAAWVNGVAAVDCFDAADAALRAVGLEEKARTRVRSLSGGQRQRVGVAAAIAHRPRLLILDEATVGIDPVARVQLRRYLNDIAEHCTILLSTHLVEDAAQLCSRILVLRDGRLVFDGETDRLMDLVNPAERGALASPMEAAYERLLAGEPE